MTTQMDAPAHAVAYRRISRRETHSSRATLAIVVAVVVILLCAYFGAEIVLAMLSLPALLGTMPELARNIVQLPGTAGSTLDIAVIAVGAVSAIVGVALIIASLTAGRRARHLIESESVSAVVDNEVIASALARHAAFAGNVDPDSVTVSVSHRTALVRLTPASGVAVDKNAVVSAVEEQLQNYRLKPSVRALVQINDSAKVGA